MSAGGTGQHRFQHQGLPAGPRPAKAGKQAGHEAAQRTQLLCRARYQLHEDFLAACVASQYFRTLVRSQAMEQATARLTIGAFAAAAGVNVETVRYYQRKGLLREPDKPYGGIRRYGDQDV